MLKRSINTTALPIILNRGAALGLGIKLGILLGAIVVVKTITRPKKAKKPPVKEVVIDYERIW